MNYETILLLFWLEDLRDKGQYRYSNDLLACIDLIAQVKGGK